MYYNVPIASDNSLLICFFFLFFAAPFLQSTATPQMWLMPRCGAVKSPLRVELLRLFISFALRLYLEGARLHISIESVLYT